MSKKVILIIRDGWGIGPDSKFNAVKKANKPYTDAFLKKYPNTVLEASGLSVGVPAGYMGSSEVGHLNMGAARIVKQEVVRINEAIEAGTVFGNPNMKRVFEAAKKSGALHVMGLVQDEGVHAHQEHLFAIIKEAAAQDIKNVYVHFFADGRDTYPRSSLTYLEKLEAKFKEYNKGVVGTVMGRYYAMDRGKQWDLTDKAFNCIVKCEGRKAKTAREAIELSYKNDKVPDGTDMTDEYIPPTVIDNYPGIKDGDGVIHFNYRQDRAIQLTNAFVDDVYPGKRDKKPDIAYCGLTRYYDAFKFNVLPPLDEGGDMVNLVGEEISKKGLKQLRIAETQKFKHVTSFFNGKMLEPYKGEDRIEIKGRFDASAYAEHPEMEAYIVKDRVIEEIKTGKYDFIAINFANGDMVGHTGVFEAAKKAIEVVDECTGLVTQAGLDAGYAVLITADHGNAEEMADEKTGAAKTAHSTYPVELIYAADDADRIKLRPKGILADIGATILDLLEVPKPKEATAESLIIK
ncbi:MAG: 2,3-bisphosphoglycerate-independent phosphoglycerate mutase [Candidatus Goldbacteria bacterium]|nr:2,3-bisphosphoglycerate-independent phosphoglycerate mutase [Candidatus Goldiibacteriota bacterium]